MTDAATTALSRAHGFHPEAIGSNRAGSLTPEQVRSVKRRGRGTVLVGLAFGLFLVGLGMVGVRSPQVFADQVPPAYEGAAAVLSIGGGALVLALVLRFVRELPADLAGRRVASAEGFIRKSTSTSNTDEGGSLTTYHYRLGRLRFDVPRAGYEALDTRRRYRVYYLPRTKIVVNIEPTDAP
jgi:hypothetical protein